MTHRDILETWYRRVWLEEDLSAIDEMMVSSAPIQGLNKTPDIGPEDFKSFTKAMLKHIKETVITIDDQMEIGDRITVLMNLNAKCRQTGKPVQAHGLAMATMADGKIAHAYNYFDFISLFEQLGILPSNTMHKCLCAEKVG